MNEVELLRKQLARERAARKQAEVILEQKSRELYATNMKLLHLNTSLEQEVSLRTQELETEKQQLSLLFEQHPLPLLLIRKEDATILRANQQSLSTFQLSEEAILQFNFSELLSKTLEEQENIEGEYVLRNDESSRYFSCNSSIIDYDGEKAFLVLLNETTETKQVWEQYLEKENAYQVLVETSGDIIFSCDADGFFTYVNPTARVITGYDTGTLIGSRFDLLVREDYLKQVTSFYVFQIENNIQSTYIEFPILTKDNKEIWLGQTVDLHRSGDKLEFIATSRDISDRKRYEKALMLSEDKYKSIIENLELGLLEVDKHGTILKPYKQFCMLTGYKEEELIGKNAVDVFLDEENRKIMDRENVKRKKGQPSVYELQIKRKDGSPIWVMISGAPYYNEKNELVGSVGIHLDITQRKLIEEELKHAKDIAEQSLRSKDLFVANISHEIRTPLNAIMGMSHLLGQSALSEKQHNYVEAIQKSSENLLYIVNDLLDFSKLESGKMELHPVAVDIARQMKEIALLWETKLEEKGLTFIRICNLNHPSTVMIDPTRLNSILNNLLHNASKFTSEGSVTLSVKEMQRTANSIELSFSVCDTGIGIPEDKLSRIFESFVQAEDSTTRKFGGTGLGLSITKSLVEMMGGELTVESTLYQGSTFSFRINLPLCHTEPEQKTDVPTILALENRKVLIVEDNQINMFMAQTILENWGIQVYKAENGAEAVEQIQHNTFDLILMDVQMPVLDGIQATWMIRNKLQCTTPIIALTANAIPSETSSYYQAGMSGYLSKPYTPESLLVVLQQFIQPSPTANSPAVKTMQDELPIAQKGDLNNVMDLTLLRKNTADNEAFFQRMLDLAIQETTRKIREMEDFIQNEEHLALKELAHSMKPTIDYVANETMRQLVRDIEKSDDATAGFQQANYFVNGLKNLVDSLKSVISVH